jgi:parallel beta-helix repeat protein
LLGFSKLEKEKLVCNNYFRKTISGGVMFKKGSSPIIFILIAMSFILSGFLGCEPLISKHPTSLTVAVGDSAAFSVEATSQEPMNYQWEKLDPAPGSSWTAISGAIYSTLTIPSVTLDDNGAKFRCAVKNKWGKATSNEAVLTVAKRIYVNSAASGDNSGTSWASAYADLQDALARAAEGYEIWVAKGTYKPTSITPVTENEQMISFQLKADVMLFGGFAGGETELSQRDWENNETVLSGDIGVEGDRGDNSCHVVIGADNALLDGFTIKDGNYGSSCYDYEPSGGSGMINSNSNPTITNCKFLNNGYWHFFYEGGGIYNNNSNPVITECVFSNNEACYGGAIYNYQSNPVIQNSSFINNFAASRAGGIYNENSNPYIINCSFIGNYGNWYGTIVNGGCTNPYIVNCIFYGNHATDCTAGILNAGSNPTITGCTFSKNTIGDGDNFAITIVNDGSSPHITNSIFWDAPGRVPQIVNSSDSNPSFGNCDIRDGLPQGSVDLGNNIYDKNPMFNDEANGDLSLDSGSPCIDKGDNFALPWPILTDIIGNQRVVGDIIDMGAYEYQQ